MVIIKNAHELHFYAKKQLPNSYMAKLSFLVNHLFVVPLYLHKQAHACISRINFEIL